MSRGWIAQHSRRKVREHDNSSPVCWLERFPYKEDVIGSSPVGPTIRSITQPRVTRHFFSCALTSRHDKSGNDDRRGQGRAGARKRGWLRLLRLRLRLTFPDGPSAFVGASCLHVACCGVAASGTPTGSCLLVETVRE